MPPSDSVRPRLLFMNRSYWPDVEATGQLLTELCEGLAEDFDVHVLAGQPNAKVGNESGEIQSQQTRNGVTIHRVPHTTFSKRSMLGKGLNFLSFCRAAGRSLKKLPQPDLCVFETDPFLLPFVGAKLKRQTGCRLVAYLQDIYPDVAVALGKVPNIWPIRSLRRRLFRIYAEDCDRVVVLSRDMQELMIESGVPASRLRIVPNWADVGALKAVDQGNVFRDAHYPTGQFVVMYSGNLGLTQRLERFIEAAAILREESAIQFAFVGRGAMKASLEQQVAERQLANVRFFDYQPKDQLSHSLSAANLHLIPLNKTLTRCLMPSKLYGILSVGRPFLTDSPAGTELHSIAKEQGVGLAVPDGSPQEIAAAIRELSRDHNRRQQMGTAARQLAETHYDRTHSIDRFKSILNEVLAE